jgi:iron complex transport system ATP-binding protein
MGDGAWLAGGVDEVMNPHILGRCLGHPIDMLRHAGRTVFIAGDSAATRE